LFSSQYLVVQSVLVCGHGGIVEYCENVAPEDGIRSFSTVLLVS